MATEKNDDKQKTGNEDAGIKPDPETLHTTDPQEHMEGPFSSLMQSMGEGFEDEKSEKEVKEDTKDE